MSHKPVTQDDNELDRTHLLLRHQTWWVNFRIPKDLAAATGRSTHFRRSLQTRDLREANRKKHAVIAEMIEDLTARSVGTGPTADIKLLERSAVELRERVRGGELNDDLASEILSGLIDGYVAAKYGRAVSVDTVDDDNEIAAIRDVYAQLGDPQSLRLSEAVSLYLAEIPSRVRPSTLATKQRRLKAFCGWLRSDRAIRAIDRRTIGRYVAEELVPAETSVKTKKDTIGDVKAFFEWALGRGEIDRNPCAGVSKTIRGSTRGAAPSRRPWTLGELETLFKGLPPDDARWAAAAIALYSGMRIEEIAATRIENVDAEKIHVPEGKTAAAVRDVPIHPVIRPLVARLRSVSTDEFLFPGLKPGGADKKRSHYLSKQFGSTIRRLGITDRAVTFHTLRNSFSTALEEAGVAESTSKLLVGHSRQSITYGMYSRGVTLDRLREAVEAVSYGPVDLLVTSRISELG